MRSLMALVLCLVFGTNCFAQQCWCLISVTKTCQELYGSYPNVSANSPFCRNPCTGGSPSYPNSYSCAYSGVMVQPQVSYDQWYGVFGLFNQAYELTHYAGVQTGQTGTWMRYLDTYRTSACIQYNYCIQGSPCVLWQGAEVCAGVPGEKVLSDVTTQYCQTGPCTKQVGPPAGE